METKETMKTWLQNKPFPLVMIEGTGWSCTWKGDTRRYLVEFDGNPLKSEGEPPQRHVIRYMEVTEQTELPAAPGHWYFVRAFAVDRLRDYGTECYPDAGRSEPERTKR